MPGPTPGSSRRLVNGYACNIENNTYVERAPRLKLGVAAPSDQQSTHKIPCLPPCCLAGFTSLVLPAWLEGLVTAVKVGCPTGSLPDEERLQISDLSRWRLFWCREGHILTDLGPHCYFADVFSCLKSAPRCSICVARLETVWWAQRPCRAFLWYFLELKGVTLGTAGWLTMGPEHMTAAT